MTSQQIRQQFIDFFVQKHGHTFVPSSPVVPHDDPTLLFTNAGMNQFKPIFLGLEKRGYTRAANTQKCIRAGGKHNDLDDVGRSRRHHTFFEMLGNWSFGDYFKREAISWSWELLTKVWGLDPTRLHVTVHAGDPAIGVERDAEAANIWREVAGVAEDHIHYGNTKDNFWEMGETGPCGPCTEIFVDRTPDKTGGPTVLSGDDPRVMEIWNNVFIQYNRNPDRSLTPLPAKHVDTGMGLERIIQVLQGKDDNYGIDLFDPFWAKLKELSGITYGGKYPKGNSADPEAEAKDAQLRHDIAFRVIADHIRCLTFALTDGAVPSNEGRGYVLRRILRRAVRFGRQQLELREPFLHTLVPVVVDAMGNAFPELEANPGRVIELVKDEEISFGKTLDRGIELFEDAARRCLSEAKTRISAEDAFKLHDTYGFPVDLTRIMAEERGMTVDLAGYETRMEQARQLAKTGGKTDESKKLTEFPPAILAQLASLDVTRTVDSDKFSHEPISARILAIWNGTDLGSSPIEAADDEPLAVILDRTNFYAEMGGQVGDAGTLVAPTSLNLGELKRADRSVFDVESTKIVGGFVLHVGRLRSGKIAVGEVVTATVAPTRRATEKNHTTTHIANWALREVLGEGIQQKGSLVDPEKLRFDFSHGKALSDEELERVETLVGQRIEQKLPVYAEEAPQEQALKINGLRAVFGEKYPPMVRIVSIGVPIKDLLADPTNMNWRKFSIEFCGGTHLKTSADAASFVVTAEESVSKGIRRIVALTGETAHSAAGVFATAQNLVERAKSLKGADISPALAELQTIANDAESLRARRLARAAVQDLQTRLRAWEKTQKSSPAAGGIDAVAIAAQLLKSAPPLGPGKLVVGEIPGAGNDQLLSAMDSLRKKTASIALMLASTADGKVNFVSAVSEDLIAKGLKAGDWIRETAKVAGGGGGGRPNMAQAGGKDPSKLPDALARAKAFAQDTVK